MTLPRTPKLPAGMIMIRNSFGGFEVIAAEPRVVTEKRKPNSTRKVKR